MTSKSLPHFLVVLALLTCSGAHGMEKRPPKFVEEEKQYFPQQQEKNQGSFDLAQALEKLPKDSNR